jgi:hypothetical protein
MLATLYDFRHFYSAASMMLLIGMVEFLKPGWAHGWDWYT